MYSTRNTLTAATRTSFAAFAMLVLTIAACAKHDASTPANAGDSASGVSTSTAITNAPDTSAKPDDITPVRGTIVSVSDSALVVATSKGDVHVVFQSPLHVFQRAKSDLSHVTSKSFIGVTSVKQADGSELATEIHIFPEELRGTGEGSYLMTPPGAKDSSKSKSTMTNGTVKAAPASGDAPRMTNGAVASNDAGKLTVDYHGGSQTITVPAKVSVTALAPAATKLATGAKVVVLAKKAADGSMTASSVVLAAEPAK
jgi:hypothetical protein